MEEDEEGGFASRRHETGHQFKPRSDSANERHSFRSIPLSSSDAPSQKAPFVIGNLLYSSDNNRNCRELK